MHVAQATIACRTKSLIIIINYVTAYDLSLAYSHRRTLNSKETRSFFVLICYNFLYEILEAIAMIRGTCGKNLTWTLDDYGMLS